MQNFTPTELNTYLQQTASPYLLDVREEWEFNVCHLENSCLIPMRTIPMHLDQLPKDQDIVVICHHGIRSRMVASFLEQNGFERVINLSGGVAGWAVEVDPHMPTY